MKYSLFTDSSPTHFNWRYLLHGSTHSPVANDSIIILLLKYPSLYAIHDLYIFSNAHRCKSSNAPPHNPNPSSGNCRPPHNILIQPGQLSRFLDYIFTAATSVFNTVIIICGLISGPYLRSYAIDRGLCLILFL